MSHDVRDGGKLVVGTVLVELDDGFDDIIGLGEVLLSDVDLLPQLYLVFRVHLPGLVIEVLFSRRKLTP